MTLFNPDVRPGIRVLGNSEQPDINHYNLLQHYYSYITTRQPARRNIS